MKQFIVWAMPVSDADDTEAGGSFRRTVELRRLIKIIARLEVIAGRLNRSPENFGRRHSIEPIPEPQGFVWVEG